MGAPGGQRRRVLLAVHDVELAVDVIAVLEAHGLAAEHVFDLDEAVLRTPITRPDAVIVDLAGAFIDHGLLRRFAASEMHSFTPALIVMSTSSACERVARRLGASHFQRPLRGEGDFGPLADVVQTAMARARSALRGSLPEVDTGGARPARSGTIAVVPRVILVARGETAREVIASFVRVELGVECVAATSVDEVKEALGPRVRAALLDWELVKTDEGRAILRTLSELDLPVVPLKVDPSDDAVLVGRAAWDAAAGLRAALAATEPKAVRRKG